MRRGVRGKSQDNRVWWIVLAVVTIVILFASGAVKVENGKVSFSPAGIFSVNSNLQNPNQNNGGKDPGDLGGNLEKCNNPATAPECCNQRDDDGNNDVDCKDPDCHTDGNINNDFSCSIKLTESGVMTCKSMDDDGTNGGFDPEVNGDTKLYQGYGEIASYSEKCKDKKTLQSLYCNPDGHNENDFIRSKLVTCGGKCLNGACVDGGRNVVISDNAFRVDLKKKVACNDGIDNDGDGAVDYPDDFSCSSSGDDDEANPKSECQDGIDNDNNGHCDFDGGVAGQECDGLPDSGCDSLQDNFESSVEKVRFGNPNVNLGENLGDVGPNPIGSNEFPRTLTNGIFVTGEGKSSVYTQQISIWPDTLFEHFRDADHRDNPDLGVSTEFGDPSIMQLLLIFGGGERNPKSDVVNNHFVDFEGQKIRMFGDNYIIIDSDANKKCLTLNGTENNKRLDLCDGSYLRVNYDAIPDVQIVQSMSDLGNNIFSWSTTAFIWDSWDQEDFVTSTSDAVIPGLEKFRLFMTEFVTPAKEISEITPWWDYHPFIDHGGIDLRTKWRSDTLRDFGVFYGKDGELRSIGRLPEEGLATSFDNTLTFVEFSSSGKMDKWFVVSGLFPDKKFGVSDLLYARISGSYVSLFSHIDGQIDSCQRLVVGDKCSPLWTNTVLTVEEMVYDGNSRWAKFSVEGGNFHKIYTSEGLTIFLPVDSTENRKGAIDLASNPSEFKLWFVEEDIDGNYEMGREFYSLIGFRNGFDETTIIGFGGNFSAGEDGNGFIENPHGSDIKEAYVKSPLATRILLDGFIRDTSATIEYHGAESYGDFYLEVI